jgi:DNA-binding NarL/FixJ family response regulator
MPTVLVIDDDPIVAVSVHDAVPDWRVEQATDGAAGLEYVRAHRSGLDVVVVDMMMPHDGIKTCIQLRIEAPHLPLLPFTGATLYTAAATELGCAPPVLKPASPDILAQALYQAVGFAPLPLPASGLLTYLQQQAAESEHAIRLQRHAVERIFILGSSEMVGAGLENIIRAAGESVFFRTTSVTILRKGLGGLCRSLLIADSDVQNIAVDVAQSFHLPLLIVARTMVAGYRAASVAQGVVVEPVSPGILAEALAVVRAGEEYCDKRLDEVLTQSTLTETEQLVGRLVLQGLKDEEIAKLVSQALQTVRLHKMHIYSKLGVERLDGFFAWAEAKRLG